MKNARSSEKDDSQSLPTSKKEGNNHNQESAPRLEDPNFDRNNSKNLLEELENKKVLESEAIFRNYFMKTQMLNSLLSKLECSEYESLYKSLNTSTYLLTKNIPLFEEKMFSFLWKSGTVGNILRQVSVGSLREPDPTTPVHEDVSPKSPNVSSGNADIRKVSSGGNGSGFGIINRSISGSDDSGGKSRRPSSSTSASSVISRIFHLGSKSTASSFNFL